MSKQITFTLDDDTYNKFTMALSLNNAEESIILEEFCNSYIADSFSRVAKSMSKKSTAGAKSVSDKVSRKIPLWASRKGQVCYNIIRGYLQLADEQMGLVSAPDLSVRCSNQTQHPDTYVKNFSTNFQQMRLDSEKSHGHVFDLTNGNVTINAAALPEIEQYKEEFLK